MESAAPTTTLTTTDNTELSRIDAHVDGALVGFAAYEVCDDGVYTFHHTEVFEGNEGRGFGQRLAEGVVRFAREQDVRIHPTCSFLASYLRKHPDSQDVLDPKFEV
ncbi:GNAT family N-acetyltransferase [Nocardioides marmoribigeumensis]|uniref:GNAT family acetyltransferase n=1 Tax=Nocardioides marmoribigeumensis TaxID=433649 RepID=A0ABU2BW02_9ACTN|nr:GNAT family N-acetyltransferase [Nocardioides marmoribigeumensis]MDR7362451.1 putative GNAT family acetyltransferase [Nocardioides marmoribigeumensis]